MKKFLRLFQKKSKVDSTSEKKSNEDSELQAYIALDRKRNRLTAQKSKRNALGLPTDKIDQQLKDVKAKIKEMKASAGFK